jgi:hypothetical protein
MFDMQTGMGSATVPVAAFGVSSNALLSHPITHNYNLKFERKKIKVNKGKYRVFDSPRVPTPKTLPFTTFSPSQTIATDSLTLIQNSKLNPQNYRNLPQKHAIFSPSTLLQAVDSAPSTFNHQPMLAVRKDHPVILSKICVYLCNLRTKLCPSVARVSPWCKPVHEPVKPPST